MVGYTAYFGVLDIGRPAAGETMVVSGAAGADGSLAGQIGKLQGCRVVGIAGTDGKCAWLVDELGFDAAINYKTEQVRAGLKQHCPDGIDIYFDNVGGDILDAALARMNNFGRVVACGLISQYNATQPVPGPYAYGNVVGRRLRIQGFIVFDYRQRYAEAHSALSEWLADGQLKYRVEVVPGLENAPLAINKLFDGTNNGKLIVQVSDEPS